MNLAKSINEQYAEGYPLANLNPILGLIGGLLQDTIITPYVEENYLFAGFSMNADKPTLTELIQ